MARRPKSVAWRINKISSGGIAKQVRRQVKAAKRITANKIKRVARSVKRTVKRSKRRIPIRFRKLKKSIKRSRKKLARAVRITRKQFKKRSKAYQLRGKKLRQRRQERRQEIKGTFDTSRARVVQARSDPGASKPGEPPKMRSGEGRYSIKAEVRERGKNVVSRTYVDKKIAPYMAMWEFRQDGKQRPFLKPGLMNNLGLFQTKVGAELKRAATSVPKRKAVVK